MKYLSICSGIEAASVAWHPLGWTPLAFSEIEAFPRAVLQHHYPNTPLHGDFTELKDQPWIVDADLLCGGTPCQAFSVAGLRQSLSDDRGNLTLQFVLLADAIDDLRRAAGRAPAWILWENVPGVLSTSDNAFGAFLGGLCGRDTAIPEPEGGWTRAGMVDGPTRCAAWRTLDAQHFGVAQRRQRVFVLALGGAGRWAAADALLPIIESSRWHPAPGRGKGEGSAGATAPSPTASGRGVSRTGESRGQDPVVACEVADTQSVGANQTTGFVGDVVAHAFTNRGIAGDVHETLRAASHGALPMVAHTLRGEGFDASEDGTGRGVPLVASTIGAQLAKKSSSLDCNGAFIPVVMAHGQANAEIVSDGSLSLTCNHEAPVVFDPTQITSPANGSNPQPGDPCHPLTAGMHPPMLVRMREGKDGGGKGPLVSEDQSLTLATANDQVLAIQGTLIGRGVDAGPAGSGVDDSGVSFTQTKTDVHAVMHGMQVRRLTPVECERLQGFPDGYTDIPWRTYQEAARKGISYETLLAQRGMTLRGPSRDECPDGPRYKALGNSWAVPCARYIGERIKALMP